MFSEQVIKELTAERDRLMGEVPVTPAQREAVQIAMEAFVGTDLPILEALRDERNRQRMATLKAENVEHINALLAVQPSYTDLAEAGYQPKPQPVAHVPEEEQVEVIHAEPIEFPGEPEESENHSATFGREYADEEQVEDETDIAIVEPPPPHHIVQRKSTGAVEPENTPATFKMPESTSPARSIVKEGMRQILSGGEHITSAEIKKRLTEMGIKHTGSNVSFILSTSPEFERVKPMKWRMVKQVE